MPIPTPIPVALTSRRVPQATPDRTSSCSRSRAVVPELPEDAMRVVLPLQRDHPCQRDADHPDRAPPVEPGHAGVRLDGSGNADADLHSEPDRHPPEPAPDGGHAGDRRLHLEGQGHQDVVVLPRLSSRDRRHGEGRNFPASAVTGSERRSRSSPSPRRPAGTSPSPPTRSTSPMTPASPTPSSAAPLDAPPGVHRRRLAAVAPRRLDPGTLFGVMFDDDTVPREGAVGLGRDAQQRSPDRGGAPRTSRSTTCPPPSSVRSCTRPVRSSTSSTPKHDVHQPPIGTEIMNQTGDVIGFASSANTYPGNASFVFADHDRTSLIHAPDPQVRPG